MGLEEIFGYCWIEEDVVKLASQIFEIALSRCLVDKKIRACSKETEEMLKATNDKLLNQ